MMATIRTLLRGGRTSTAIGIHAHFDKNYVLSNAECFEFIRPGFRPVPCIGRIDLLVSSTAPPWNMSFISAKARPVRIARMLVVDSFAFGCMIAKSLVIPSLATMLTR
jgi:hypothetical protein